MGPLLFSRILDLNDVQTGVLTMVFKIADDQGLLLLDLKDLSAMVQYCGDHAKELKKPVREYYSRNNRHDTAKPARARPAGRRAVLR